MTESPTVANLVRRASVLLCCGTGGVGKTTTAAALALLAARQGRRAVVVTIDPAKRLADALGLDGIDNDCVRVEGTDTDGELWVTMLDTKATFDALIVRNAADEAQAERILQNRYYRNLSTGLSGTQEFMAMERLHELHTDERFDLVVVDTPPSRNALDFLDAPERMARFLDGRFFRLAAPGRRIARTLAAPMLVFLRRVARVVSPEVVDDTLAFIEAFSGMEDGFKERAAAVDVLMSDADTGFVLITSPAAEAVIETEYLAKRLIDAALPIEAVVINRIQPRFTALSVEELATADVGDIPEHQLDILRRLTRLAETEDAQLQPILELANGSALSRIRQLDDDVHDLAGIAMVADLLGES